MPEETAPRSDAQERDIHREKNIPNTDSPSSVPPPQSTTPKRSDSLRAGAAVVMGRAAGALSRRLRLGGGTSIVGVVAQRIYPPIVEHLAEQLVYGSFVVTGTNGKTTTSSFIAAILRDAGLRVWRNREGSNLMGGVAGSLVIRAQPNGRLRRSGKAVAVLEIDEAVLPQVVQFVTPRVAVVTNLFRDQLDRYGEVDSVITYWKKAIELLDAETTTLVLNADDPAVAYLGSSYEGRTLYYGIDDASLNLLQREDGTAHHQVVDTHTCPRCGHELDYSMRFFSHMGHYACPHCGYIRPEAAIRATRVQTDTFDRLRVTIEDAISIDTQQRELVIPLPGIYNVYNALAASTATRATDVAWEPIISGIEQSKPVFGRGERIQVEGRTVRLLLAKNPTGFNEVLRTLFSESVSRHVLFVLNNNIADGRDISWIWDVDFERCVGHIQTLTVAGTRALDLALRLTYAGIPEEDMTIVPPALLRLKATGVQVGRRRGVEELVGEQVSVLPKRTLFGLKIALQTALDKVPEGETLFIVPTYTGLLEVHSELEQRGLTARYWEERDN
jgi:UDP-N-acetylmuramyl tripeptide synthase